ncbi:hypothetical protein OKA04_10165 [Luteolibacter flavescens]|uniref:Uncharacterized protein n=1 Tax=Luteolibacter flavescens TaxID=1859460 RepID=A0ABT3FNF2_9BACT|nr:hypothetical protein [Luteolibacter flavescens]MCW1885092.1 hypothetical protein [Luteolibacter flavescens]
MALSRALTNDPSAARLISLAKLAMASQIQPHDAHGPYVIVQTGYAPGDLTMKAADHLLGRSGEWLALHWFVRLPVEERHAEFVFGTAGEVMTFMESLTGKVVVITGREDPGTGAPEEDEWHRTITGS